MFFHIRTFSTIKKTKLDEIILRLKITQKSLNEGNITSELYWIVFISSLLDN